MSNVYLETESKVFRKKIGSHAGQFRGVVFAPEKTPTFGG